MLNKARHAANSSPAASHTAITALTPVFSGSCALMSIYDPKAKKLRVACTGDSRAVLGRWDSASNSYTCHELSTDQTGFNEAEISRIAAEHPEEPDILNPESGRLMGMAVTRAFGDHRWKWDNEFITKLQYKFWGPAPRPQSKTPPYMTAEPVVTETDIVSVIPDSASNRKITISGSQRTTTQGGSTNEVRRSDFMIMASDGLWDHISSSDAILCVQRWLEARERGEGSVRKDPQWNPTSTSTSGPFSAFSPAPSSSLSSPPSDPSAANSDTADFTYSISKSEEITWAAHPQYFAIEDENAAVCLMKNAMGGTRRELVAGLMSLAGPLRRNAIDDTTIMVVFFDELLQPVGV
jgi:pyruvate dehydrogenase phosphatase